jgi:hypothetical protein
MCFVYSSDSDSDPDIDYDTDSDCGCGKEPQKECQEIVDYLNNIKMID